MSQNQRCGQQAGRGPPETAAGAGGPGCAALPLAANCHHPSVVVAGPLPRHSASRPASTGLAAGVLAGCGTFLLCPPAGPSEFSDAAVLSLVAEDRTTVRRLSGRRAGNVPES
jgi:hypothetical protein